MSDGDCPTLMCCGGRESKLQEEDGPKVSLLQLQALSSANLNPLSACMSGGNGRTRDFELNVEEIDARKQCLKNTLAPRPLALERAMQTAMEHEECWAEWQVPEVGIPQAAQANREDLGNGVYRLSLQESPPSGMFSRHIPGIPGRRAAPSKTSSVDSQTQFFMPDQTILLFDWDDTLFPSNWLQRSEGFFRALSPAETAAFAKLQNTLGSLLNLALQLGRVIIVTNSSEPWVNISVGSFLPALQPIIQRIPVVYARSTYEKGNAKLGGAQGAQWARSAVQSDPIAPKRWKEEAFGHQIRGFYSRYQGQSWKNLLSIGDQCYERDAARSVVRNSGCWKTCRLKTVKFLENPSIDELTAEIRVLTDALQLMVQCDGNLDVEIDFEDLQHGLSLADKILDQKTEAQV